KSTAVLLLALLTAAGCEKDKDVEPPAELVEVRPTIHVERLWSQGVGEGGERLRLALGLAADGDRVYAAARHGVGPGLAADTGRTIWRADTKLELAGGPAAGNGILGLGTNDGDVRALEAADGKQRWRVKVSGEVLADPLVAGDRVIVRTVDGRLRALA